MIENSGNTTEARAIDGISRVSSGFFLAEQSAISKKAFTLIELLVVVGIIGVLAGIVIGISSFASRRAAESRAISDLEKIKTVLEEIRIAEGRYVGPSSGSISGPITNLTINGIQLSAKLSNYTRDIRLVDPWGRGYRYSNSAAIPFAYRLWSLGPNATNSADDIETGIGNY